MEELRKAIGLLLIIIGSLMLIILAFNFETYVLGFKDGPIYTILSEDVGGEFILSFNGQEIKTNGGGLSIITLFFTFMFLSLWLKIGGKILEAGAKIFSPELRTLKDQIEELTSKVKEHFKFDK